MSARAEAQVAEALLEHWAKIPPEGAVFLAVSGGVDSMVLLEGVHRFCAGEQGRQRLSVLHVNHGLRGEESEGDEAFVREAARARGIDCRVFRLSWPEGAAPSQDDCRRRREEIFAGLCRAPGDRVLLAHHRDDQAETLLFRLIRGTGLKGLRGMAPVAGRKHRPFLGLGKVTLLAAARGWGLSWREDSSNASLGYERNWVRAALLPLIEERRPGFPERLAALAEEVRALPPAAAIERFPFGGVEFARPAPGCGERELHEAFRLSRLHARALRELLDRPSGSLHAEKARFSWSAGVLLAERDERFEPQLLCTSSGAESALGRWELAGGWAASAGEAGAGERAKKEFQRLRVPLFFRPAVPLLWEAGKPRALLPARLHGLPARFTPSPLARWWLGE